MTSATSDGSALTRSGALRARRRIGHCSSVLLNEERGAENIFRARGSAHVFEKAQDGRGNPRKSRASGGKGQGGHTEHTI